MKWLWQFNLEVSLLLGIILLARTVLRSVTNTYNNYLLWLSIPLALVAAKILTAITYSSPISEQARPIQIAVHRYIVRPPETFDSWAVGGTLVAILSMMLLVRLAFQHWNLRLELKRISCGLCTTIQSEFPVVSVSKEGFSPAVYGFLKPTIYFPKELLESLSTAQIELIIQHEEQHVKLGHLWLNFFWDILVCVLWFNPLAYFARQRFRHDQELYCDYIVLKNSNSHDRRSYGHALLTTVSATHSVSLLCPWKMFNQLEERIMNIKSTFTTPKKLLIAFFSALLACSTSMYSLAMAGGDENTKTQLRILVDKEAKRNIKLYNNGVTYFEENGERFVEIDGTRRPMNDEELVEYDKMFSIIDIKGATEIELDGSSPDKKSIVVRSFDGELDKLKVAELLKGIDGLEGLDGLEKLEGLEGLKGLEALRTLGDIEVKVLSDVGVSFSSVEHELAEALRHLEGAKENDSVSKAELKRAAKQLKEMQKQLVKDKERMEQTRQKARLAAKKAKEQLQQSDAI